MAKYNFNDFLRECKEAWKEIWKEDLPKDMSELYPDNQYNPQEQLNLYKRDKAELSKHRRKVSIILIIVLFIGFNISKNVFDYIRTSEFVSCFGKDVCIYRGPKMNYIDSLYPRAILLSNNDILVFHNSYPLFMRRYYQFLQNLDYFNLKNKIRIYSKKHYLGKMAEIYKNNYKHFYKINVDNIFKSKFDQAEIIDLIEDSSGNIIIISAYTPITIYNTKKNKFIKTNYNYFNTESFNYLINPIDSNFDCPYSYLGKYKNIIYMVDKKTQVLYSLNVDTFEKKRISSFAKNLGTLPQKEDVIFLKSGIIIFPIIINKRKGYIGPLEKTSKLDHIEIYNPYSQTISLTYNTDVLDKNIFIIEKNDKNILFINRFSSYIFDSNNNKFYKTNFIEFKKNLNDIEKLNKLVNDIFKINLNYSIKQKLDFIEISENVYLLTCNPLTYTYYLNENLNNNNYYDINNFENICQNTILYDYKNSKIIMGPKFIYKKLFATPVNFMKDKTIFIGGIRFQSFYKQYKLNSQTCSKYTQIVKYIKKGDLK